MQTFKIEIMNPDTGKIIAEPHYTASKFPGGELNIVVDNSSFEPSVLSIIGTIKSADDIMELLLLTDAIERKNFFLFKTLVLPYVPYGRQDRVCNVGEALSIKVFANLINSMNFNEVITHDNHSDVSSALINHCRNVSVKEILENERALEFAVGIRPDYLVSPDAGANKKVQILSIARGIPMIRADKTRDTRTGEITGTVVYSDDLTGKNVLIIDDICDGGRTFIELAKALREKGAEHITLYITHGIFSKGVEVVLEHVDHIVTTNSWYDDVPDENVTVIKVI